MNTQSFNPMGAASPDDAAALESLYATGHWLMSEDRYADASVVFRLMLRASPTDERAWLALGTCHERLGQNLVALELWGAGSIAAAPARRCTLARFRALWDADRLAEADEAFDELLAIAEDEGSEAVASAYAERRLRP